MPTCSLCQKTNDLNNFVCVGCWLKASKESYNCLFGQGRFDTLEYELSNIKEELKEIKILFNKFLPQKIKLTLRQDAF